MPTALPKYQITDEEQQSVQIWVNPSNAWVAVPRLRCETLRQVVQPFGGISTATLSYDYGFIDDYNTPGGGFVFNGALGSVDSILHTTPFWDQVAPSPLDIMHRFIRVLVVNNDTALIEARWVGIITFVTDNDFKQSLGPLTASDSVQVYGTQEFQVSGPEWILNRKQITTSVGLSNGVTGKTFQRGIPFNIREGKTGARSGAAASGNQRDTVLSTEFTTDSDNWTTWNAEDIVFYLWFEHLPITMDLSTGDSPTFTWFLLNQSILSSIQPQLTSHGKTIYQIFNELATPKRFLDWSITYAATGDVTFGTWTIEFNSASGSTIDMPTPPNIPGNPRTVSLVTSGTIDGRIRLVGDGQNEFKQVIVEGARIGHVQTVKVGNGPLAPGWSSTDEAAYIAGVTVAGDTNAQQAANDNLRGNLYRDVFTRFVSTLSYDYSPIISAAGLPLYIPGLRWSRVTPLKENWDYSVNPPVANAGASENPEYIPLFAVYKYTITPQPTRYVFHDKIAGVLRNDGVSPGAVSSVQIRPLEDTFGVSIIPQQVQAHWQAKQESIIKPNLFQSSQFDYNDDIFLTGYFQEDLAVTGFWPSDVNNTSNASTLTIQVGDLARHDILLELTVVGLDSAGQLVQAPATIDLQNDSAVLKNIARLAYEWYGVRRYAYSISYGQIVKDVLPGMIVIDVDGASTDVVVTEVVWDFKNRQTNIGLAFAQPDFRLLAQEALTL